MQEEKNAAKALLIEVRDRGLGGPEAARLIEAALPPSGAARIAFMLVLATYIAGALAGVPVDPEFL
jgi:hypothetical protein